MDISVVVMIILLALAVGIIAGVAVYAALAPKEEYDSLDNLFDHEEDYT